MPPTFFGSGDPLPLSVPSGTYGLEPAVGLHFPPLRGDTQKLVPSLCYFHHKIF